VHDLQSPGSYRVMREDDGEIFGWAVGPGSWKNEYFPPSQVMWRSEIVGDTLVFSSTDRSHALLAIVGARPCDVAALRILDHVLEEGAIAIRDIRSGATRTSSRSLNARVRLTHVSAPR